MIAILEGLLKVGGPVNGPLFLVVGLLIIILGVGLRILWKTNKRERDKSDLRYDRILKENREESQTIIREMFEVINKNTEVISKNTETTHGLCDSIRELRTVITIKND